MQTRLSFFVSIVVILSAKNALATTVMRDSLPDMYYEYQFAELNKKTPIHIEYHKAVAEYLDIYLGKRKEEFGNILGLADLYFPIFDQYLDKHQLPLELKYLAIIESALNNKAVSTSGACGLWQFKINTARMFDLQVNSYTDERYDTYKSTEAACKYLKYLHTTFNDWLLAISAYNGGPGAVRNAIERAGGNTNYWEIRKYMTHQTQNYVPAFLAAMYVFENYEQHNIQKTEPKYTYANTDTVIIQYQLSFTQIQQMIDISTEQLEFLNPSYKINVIPETGSNILILPKNKIAGFISNEIKIRAQHANTSTYTDLLSQASQTFNKTKLIHTVKKGEFYHKIALQYNCTIENLKAWNNLTTDALHPGQQLIIWVNTETNESLLNN